ncbi:Dicer-like protein 1 [Agyrium rufum]|nr:Dicer-like protein 1 [Agyrium rufum]
MNFESLWKAAKKDGFGVPKNDHAPTANASEPYATRNPLSVNVQFTSEAKPKFLHQQDTITNTQPKNNVQVDCAEIDPGRVVVNESATTNELHTSIKSDVRHVSERDSSSAPLRNRNAATTGLPKHDEYSPGLPAKDDNVNRNDVEGSDSDDDVPHQGRPRHVTERRKMQNSVFSAWLANRSEKVTKDEVKQAIQSADDELLSMRSLMSKQESQVIISDPREYQMELFERAKNENIIAVLDTGSGKTLIAVLLLRHILDKELEDRAAGKKPRISFFLVDSVTLVFQQFAVLECNLSQKLDRFCGDMNPEQFPKETWTKHFTTNMGIVCTAEILYQCLMRSFISMEQINLLIFDEAHHTKKNHPYAKIIKEHYLSASPERRPKIFGMTASPADAKTDVVQAATELETLLHSKIATAANLTVLQSATNRPKEQVILYDRIPCTDKTKLYEELKSRYEDVECFKKLFLAAEYTSRDLGDWCADKLWSFALVMEQGNVMERKLERKWSARKEARPVQELDQQLLRLREAQDFVRDWSFMAPEDSNMSAKVLCLQQLLAQYFERPTDAKCIIFVERRYTARVLQDLFSRIGSKHLRIGLLIGAKRGEAGDIKLSFRQQVLTMMKFKTGELNCLFATSVAEEGLDIPDCNIIVRFDLFKTMIQYIQSRGRARHKNSHFFLLVEKDNAEHVERVREVREAETILRQFCGLLPPDRLLKGNDWDIEDALAKERNHRTFIEPTTGAKLTYSNSLTVLSHFVSSLPHDNETVLQTTYTMGMENRQFVCEVNLPSISPVTYAKGLPYASKSIAKRSAAFQACLLLRKGQYLDEHLLPIYHKVLPAMRNAHLALAGKKGNTYDMRVKPNFWEKGRGTTPDKLYLTVIRLEKPEVAERPCRPIGILTRLPMPSFPRFPIHLGTDRTSDVACLTLSKPLDVTLDNLVTALTTFTYRVYDDLFNKTYENEPGLISYLLAPILDTSEFSASALPESVIDWDLLKMVQSNIELVWTPKMLYKELEDKFLVDKWDGGRRFWSQGVLPGLKPMDPVPEDAAPAKHMENILGYTNSLWKKSRMNQDYWDLNQPVVLAQKILHRRNLLDEWETDPSVKTRAYVLPQVLRISVLPTPVAFMCYLFPAIIWRIDAYLVALDVGDLLGLRLHPDLALEAVTKDSDNTEEHRNEQIHVQRGMGKNYERLEFIGDCFLKMATSISLYAQNPVDDEFESHVKRMLMICNKNLFNHAINKWKLYEYVRTQAFNRRDWYPLMPKQTKGKGFNKEAEAKKHHLNDKSIADVCEALIGAALLSSSDLEGGQLDQAVKAVTLFVDNDDHRAEKWDDYYRLYAIPAYQIAEATASQIDMAKRVEAEGHDYHFKHPRLLRSAFSHSSQPFSFEKVPNYQRLEFLGDALLDHACIDFIYHSHPDRDPQWLTEHKMAMVSNKFLGALCVKLGFHKHLRANHSSLLHQITEYVTEIEAAEQESQGARDYWTTTKNPPKCLPDMVEAYIGAIFVDSEFNIDQVMRFFSEHIRWFFEDMSIYDTFANHHPTTFLSNLLANDLGCTNYRLMSGELPSLLPGDTSAPRIAAAVLIHGEVVAEGTSSSSRYAKIKAAKNAVDVLQGLAPFEFRKKYGCDCHEAEGIANSDGNGDGGKTVVDTAI